MNTGFKTTACLAASLFMGASASAATIYENAANPTDPLLRTSEAAGVEFGDQVTFDSTERTLTSWSFEYYITPNSGITAQAMLRTLVDATPSDAIYDSGAVALGDGYGTFVAEGLSLDVPANLVWTVTFAGGGDGDEFGLLFYEGPEIGNSDNFYWRNEAGNWIMLDTEGVTDNFAAQFVAIPEPSTWALLVGGLGMLGLWNFRRKA